MTIPAHDLDHVLPQLGLYALGALPAGEVAPVEEHLGSCPACRAEADELSEVRACLDLLRDFDIGAARTLGEFPPRT